MHGSVMSRASSKCAWTNWIAAKRSWCAPVPPPLHPSRQPALPPPAQQEQQQQQPSRLEQLLEPAQLTEIAQEVWGQFLRPGDTVVDATAGTGRDAAFLAAAVGSGGTLHAFDIQPEALAATRERVLQRHQQLGVPPPPTLHCHLASHADMAQYVAAASARLVVFNLGWLPGAPDRKAAAATQPDSTVAALHAACQVLSTEGLCSVLCYPGHPGEGARGCCRGLVMRYGAGTLQQQGPPAARPLTQRQCAGCPWSGGREEYEAVQATMAALPPREWLTTEFRLLNRCAPVLLLAWKRRRHSS